MLNAAIDGPDEMGPTAPRVISVQIPVDKIGELIGPKGKMINAIQDETGADISIEEDGTVYIGAIDGPSAEAARAQVNAIANPHLPEVGEQFLGTVVKIADVRRLHLAPARQGRPAAHLRGSYGQVELKEIDPRGKPQACGGPGRPKATTRGPTSASGASRPAAEQPAEA